MYLCFPWHKQCQAWLFVLLDENLEALVVIRDWLSNPNFNFNELVRLFEKFYENENKGRVTHSFFQLMIQHVS